MVPSDGGTRGTGGSIGDLEWPSDATAHFDEHGILNADCTTDEDCAMTLGYHHAAERFVCEALPKGPKCTIQLLGGQSGHLGSLTYEDLLFPYLRNEPMPLVFDIDEASANAVHTVTFD